MSASQDPSSLLTLRPAQWARVEHLAVDPTDAHWLAAVGLQPGSQVCVLRQAALGGPLHVRTSNGGAFALGARLAGLVHVRVEASAA